MTVTIGTRLRVRTNSGSHNYPIGSVVTVVHADSDGTFKCRHSDGTIGNWLRMRDCEPAGDALWTALQRDLPEDVVHFLSSFDGLEQLTVRDDVAADILMSLPDLLDRIVAEGRALKRAQAEQSAAATRTAPSSKKTGASSGPSTDAATPEDANADGSAARGAGADTDVDTETDDFDALFSDDAPAASDDVAAKEVA